MSGVRPSLSLSPFPTGGGRPPPPHSRLLRSLSLSLSPKTLTLTLTMQFHRSIHCQDPSFGILYGTRGTPTGIIRVGVRRGADVAPLPPRATAPWVADHQAVEAGERGRGWPEEEGLGRKRERGWGEEGECGRRARSAARRGEVSAAPLPLRARAPAGSSLFLSSLHTTLAHAPVSDGRPGRGRPAKGREEDGHGSEGAGGWPIKHTRGRFFLLRCFVCHSLDAHSLSG